MVQQSSFYALLGGVKPMQVIVDAVNAKYNNTAWKRDFVWGREQLDLNFNVLSSQVGIAAMAAVIDMNAPKPLRNVRGISHYGGSIPKFGHAFDVDETDMRNQQYLIANGGAYDPAVIADVFFGNIDKLIQGAHARLNNMAEQARSTGSIVVNGTNNPDGTPSYVNVDLRVPAANKKKAGFGQTTPAAWTDLTDGNPIQDLIDMVKFADDNGSMYGAFEMSKTLWNSFIVHPAVTSFVKGRLQIQSGVAYAIGERDVRAALDGFNLPPIVISDNRQSVEIDGVNSILTDPAFDAGNVILRPSAVLGEVKNAISMHRMAPSDPLNVRTTAEQGRFALLSTWDSKSLINHVELECLAIPTLSNPKNLVILDTTEAHS